MNDNRKLFVCASLVLAIALLASCVPVTPPPAAPAAPAGQPAAPAAAALTPKSITYAIGAAPSVLDAFIYVAQELYAPQEALTIKVVVAQGSLDSVKFTVVGQADVASANVLANAMAHGENLPSVDVFDAYQKYDFGIVSLENSGIKSVADLKGKKVGYVSLSSTTYPNLYAMLSSAKMTKDDITPVVVGINGPTALQQGQIDALSSWETQWAGVVGSGVKLNIIRGDQSLNWDGGGIFVSQDKIDKDPDMVLRVVRMLYKTFMYCKANPEKSFEIVTKALPEATQNKEASLASWKATIDAAFAGTAQTKGLGFIDVTRRQAQSDFLFGLELIKTKPDMTTSVNTKFIDQVQKELKDWKP